MSTLLLRLAAPLQSWGGETKFDRRGTERVPTKSGVIGMIASALGRGRHESIEDLLQLRFGVRVDKEGRLLRDFHIAQSQNPKDPPYVSNRYYLADAVFLAGLEGDEEKLQEIDEAIRSPAYPLFLGRRSCPPEGKVSLGIRTGKQLLDALQEEPLQTDKPVTPLRLVFDAGAEDSTFFMVRDLPMSFSPERRMHGFRRVSEQTISSSHSAEVKEDFEPITDHDPFLEGGF